jgi:hypothetical protein
MNEVALAGERLHSTLQSLPLPHIPATIEPEPHTTTVALLHVTLLCSIVTRLNGFDPAQDQLQGITVGRGRQGRVWRLGTGLRVN